jgi:hypothetical protein
MTRRMRPEGNRRPRLVPTQLAAMAAGVTEATIRKWASRGKLTRYGRPGRAEYDLDEILRLFADEDLLPAHS